MTAFDLAARTVTANRPDQTVRTYGYDSLIVGAGAEPVLLRSRRVRPLRDRHEDHRRRPRAAGPHLRGLRDGRERGGSARYAGRGSPSSWSAVARPGWSSPGRSPSFPAPVSRRNFRRIDPRRRRSCSSTAAGDPRDVRRPALAEGRERAASASASRSAPGRWSPGSTPSASTSRPRRLPGPGRVPGRRSGQPASRPHRSPGCSPRPAERRATERPHRGPARLHAAGPSGGLRDRRHDGPRRPAGSRRGRHAVGHPRREHHQAPTPRARRRRPSPTATSGAWPRSRSSTRW